MSSNWTNVSEKYVYPDKIEVAIIANYQGELVPTITLIEKANSPTPSKTTIKFTNKGDFSWENALYSLVVLANELLERMDKLGNTTFTDVVGRFYPPEREDSQDETSIP